VDVFPTIDKNTVIVAPLNGLFDPNPSICPPMPGGGGRDARLGMEGGGGTMDSRVKMARIIPNHREGNSSDTTTETTRPRRCRLRIANY
jgi:hypothetical protein